MQRTINYFLLLLITFNIFFVSLGAYLYPIASIDAVSIWFLKAKAFYLNNGHIPLEVLKDKFYLNTHPQYPLLLPFIFYIFYVLLNGINENVVAFINPLLYLLIIIVVYKLLREMEIKTTLSLALTYAYSMLSPFLAQGGRKHSGDVDIFIVFINWVTIFLTFKFIKNKNYKIFWTIVALIMISSQVKGEGIFLISILFFMPVTKKLKIFSVILSFVPLLLWRVFIYYYQIPNDFYFLIPPLEDIIIRFFDIFHYVLREMLKINNWYFFWPVFFIFMIFGGGKMHFINRFIVPSFSMICVLFFIFYLFLSVEPKIYVPSSIDRILLQLSPFYYLLFAESVKNILSRKHLFILKTSIRIPKF